MIPGLRMLGGRLCLDLANTVDPRHGGRPHDFLTGYGDVVRWAVQAGAVTVAQAHALLGHAGDHPAEARAAFESALELRDRVHRVFSAVAAGARPDPGDLQALVAANARAATHGRLVAGPDGYEWGWDEDPRRLDRVIWPVARDAVDLLVGGRLDRIRECPGADGCGWLFYDTSRSGARRWCSMEVCGNRAKGRRHYRRRRTGDGDVEWRLHPRGGG